MSDKKKVGRPPFPECRKRRQIRPIVSYKTESWLDSQPGKNGRIIDDLVDRAINPEEWEKRGARS